MTDCTPEMILFPARRERRVEAGFDGGDVTSNGGALLLRQVDRVLGLTAAAARGLVDTRQPGKVRHRLVDMLHQRVFGIALGYEDLIYVFSGDHLLVAYLRQADIDVAKHSLGVLKLLVDQLRQAWPETRIVVRAEFVRRERPVRTVAIAKAFALGRFEVTRREFSIFVRRTGYSTAGDCYFWTGRKWDDTDKKDWRDPGFPGYKPSWRDPAVCVN